MVIDEAWTFKAILSDEDPALVHIVIETINERCEIPLFVTDRDKTVNAIAEFARKLGDLQEEE